MQKVTDLECEKQELKNAIQDLNVIAKARVKKLKSKEESIAKNKAQAEDEEAQPAQQPATTNTGNNVQDKAEAKQEAQPENIEQVVQNKTVVAEAYLTESEIKKLFEAQDMTKQEVRNFFMDVALKKNVTEKEIKAGLYDLHCKIVEHAEKISDKPEEPSVVVGNERIGNRTGYNRAVIDGRPATTSDIKTNPLFETSNFGQVLATTSQDKLENVVNYGKHQSTNLQNLVNNRQLFKHNKRFFDVMSDIGQAVVKGVDRENTLPIDVRKHDLGEKGWFAVKALGSFALRELWEQIHVILEVEWKKEYVETQILDRIAYLELDGTEQGFYFVNFDEGAEYQPHTQAGLVKGDTVETRRVLLSTKDHAKGHELHVHARDLYEQFDYLAQWMISSVNQLSKKWNELLGATIAQIFKSTDHKIKQNATPHTQYGIETWAELSRLIDELVEERGNKQDVVNVIVVPRALRVQTEMLLNSQSLYGQDNPGVVNPYNSLAQDFTIIYSNVISQNLPAEDKYTIFAFSTDDFRKCVSKQYGSIPRLEVYYKPETQTVRFESRTSMNVECIRPENVIAVTHKLTDLTQGNLAPAPITEEQLLKLNHAANVQAGLIAHSVKKVK